MRKRLGRVIQNRHLSKDYELLPEMSEAMIRLMLQRLGQQQEKA